MKTLLIILTLIACVCIGCTENERARSWGGTEKIELNQHEILLNITWKGTDMWLLTIDTTTHIKHFRERSTLGIMEGEIIIQEH